MRREEQTKVSCVFDEMSKQCHVQCHVPEGSIRVLKKLVVGGEVVLQGGQRKEEGVRSGLDDNR